jgi:hypothetical protein
MKFSIELGSEENAERNDIEPEEERDACAERAIDLRVVGKTCDVPAEGEGGEEPQRSGKDSAGKNSLPGLLHGSTHVVDEADNADTADERNTPADKKSDGVDRSSGRRNDVHGQPFRNELTEDNDRAGQSEGDQRERDEEKSAETALQEGPAVGWEVVGAANAFHQRGKNAGCSGEADDERENKGVSRTGAVRRVDEVALQQRTDVRRKDAIKERGELKAQWSVIGKQADDGGGDDERGKQRHHGRVGSGLGKVETVVPPGANKCTVKNAKKAQESSHEVVPRV